MPNILGGYDLTFFANEALIQLEQALGFAARTHRGYEPTPQQRGSDISIPKPSTFSAKDAPSSDQDVDADEVKITLNQWREVKFALTDKELHYSEDRIIEDHIRPAAYALALDVGQKMAGLYVDVPWDVDVDTSTIKNNLINPRKILRQNGAPLDDGMVHLGADANLEADLLGADFMSNADVGGEAGEETLMRGTLGRRLGVEMFADGTIQEHTSGTVISAGNDNALALNGAATEGDTTIDVDGGNASETLKAGDSFVIAGNRQRYVVTEDKALSTGSATGVKIAPALVQDYSDGSAVTFDDGTGNGDNFYANLMFHRNAFALGTAPIQGELGTEQARRQGIQVENVNSEESNLALRSRLWYDADNSKTVVALDILYGYKTLDRNLAVRVRGDV